MASYTFLLMQTTVMESTSLTSSDLTRVKSFINEAYADFVDRTSLKQDTYTFDLVAAQSKYDIDAELADWVRFRSISVTGGNITSSVPLEIVDVVELAELQQNNDGSGVPTHIAFLGLEQFIVYPTPDAAYDLAGVYVKTVSALSAYGDIPAVPVRYHQAIVEGAIMLALKWDRQPEWIDYKTLYEEWVGRCKNDIKRVHGSKPRALRPSSYMNGSTDRTMTDRLGN